MVLEILKVLLSDRLVEAAAQAMRTLRANRQSSLDGRSRKAAWPLACLPEIGSARRCLGGTEEEIEVIAGWLKSVDDLEKRVKSSPTVPDKTTSETPAGEANAGAKGNKGGGNGKAEGDY